MPRSALNFLLLIATAALFRFLVWHLFGIEIGKTELWSVLGLRGNWGSGDKKEQNPDFNSSQTHQLTRRRTSGIFRA